MATPAPFYYAPVTGVQVGLGPSWSQVICIGPEGCRGKTKFARPSNMLPDVVHCCWCGREIHTKPPVAA